MAANPFNVSVPVLDYSKPYHPTTQTYHGTALMVNNKIIGRIQSWQLQGVYSRQVNPVRELNYQTFGRVVDLVPSINEPYTASFSRVEVWEDEMEKACGFSSVWTDLLDQTFPFTVKEIWKKGKQIYRITEYLGCWFTDKNLNAWQAEGDAKVQIDGGTIAFVSKSIVYGR